MATIKFSNIKHSYLDNPNEKVDEDWALKELNHTWQDGDSIALLGPSGCGKTTLLNIISGLIKPSSGLVMFDDKKVNNLATEDRNIAQVFQFPVVYDTMTIRDNLAFPLKNQNFPEDKINNKVNEVARILEIDDILDKKTNQLNADAKQKVSLGRGLVRDNVAAILFDEPLTVVDPNIKWQLRSSLKTLQRKLDFTMIYVTHDQTEALTFANTIMVMLDGKVVQTGTPLELFEYPQHTFVGHFIGSPGMNVIPCRLDNNKAFIKNYEVPVTEFKPNDTNGETSIGVRPEFIKFSNDGMTVNIEKVHDLDRHKLINLRLFKYKLKMLVPPDVEIPADPRISFQADRTFVYQNNWVMK